VSLNPYRGSYRASVSDPRYGAVKPTKAAPCRCEWPLAALDEDDCWALCEVREAAGAERPGRAPRYAAGGVIAETTGNLQISRFSCIGKASGGPQRGRSCCGGSRSDVVLILGPLR